MHTATKVDGLTLLNLRLLGNFGQQLIRRFYFQDANHGGQHHEQ
jgi:hypothetical protein